MSPGTRAIEVATEDQYRVEADAFSEAVRSLGPLPTEPTDAVANLEVLERIVENASS